MRKTEYKNTIGGRIRKMRIDAGMTQEQLAEKLCTTKGLISQYENDRIDIKTSIMQEIAAALGTSVAYLVDGVPALAKEQVELMRMLGSIQNPKILQIAMEQVRALSRLE